MGILFLSLFSTILATSQSTEDGKRMSEAAAFSGVVFFYQPHSYLYQMTFTVAKQACKDIGAVIASPAQLLEAQKNGLQQCDWGWLEDQTVGHTIGKPGGGDCEADGELLNGARSLGRQEADEHFNVFCYIEGSEGEIFFESITDCFTYDEAEKHCRKLNSDLATPAQLSFAWRQGFKECRPGWLKDHSVRFPIGANGHQCGAAGDKVDGKYVVSYNTSYPFENSGFDAYCFGAKGEAIIYPKLNLFTASEATAFSGPAPKDWKHCLVFYYRPKNGRYSLTFVEAKKACLEMGAVIANIEQLKEAYKNGLSQCNYGWLEDLTVQYPIAKADVHECKDGSKTQPGIRSLGWQAPNKHFDVYCYLERPKGDVFLSTTDVFYTYNAAEQHCKTLKSTLATPAQLSFAWKVGFHQRRPGWLKDHSVRFHSQSQNNQCEASWELRGKVYNYNYWIGHPDDSLPYAAYCFQELELSDENEATADSGIVFHYRPALPRYKMTYPEAVETCGSINAVIANPDQLRTANKNGLHSCDYGWIKDRSVQCSLVRNGNGTCENPWAKMPGVVSIGIQDIALKFDVYCYREKPKGKVFISSSLEYFSYYEASRKCREEGASLASPADLSVAWKEYLNECRPGWLSDGSVRFLSNITTVDCAKATRQPKTDYSATFQRAFPEKRSHFDVYCFRPN